MTDKHLKKFLGDKKFAKGLDVGFGMGRSMLTFKDNVDDYYGIEINKELLNYFKQKKEFENKFKLGLFDGENIPFPDKHFNFVSMITVYEHIKNPQKLLQEIYRVLADDGFLIIQNDAWFYGILERLRIIKNHRDKSHINMRTPGFMKKELEKNNFKIIKSAIFPFWKYGEIYQKIIPSFLGTKGTFICIKNKKINEK